MDRLIVPLAPASIALPRPLGSQPILTGPAAARIQISVVRGNVRATAQAGPGERRARASGNDTAVDLEIAPVLVMSSLDPVDSLWIVRCPLTQRIEETLTRLAGVPVVPVDNDPIDDNDIWVQDAVEFAVAPHAGGHTVVPFLGLRGRHDQGLTCGPLDRRVAEAVTRTLPDAAPLQLGPALSGRRWIDWFGNLEATPPLPGYPDGRILTGRQRELALHGDVLAFLRDQERQWPPVTLDVSWLTIGHVDELIGFVPATGRPGWRALMPSPARARTLLRTVAPDTLVLGGTAAATTVGALRALAESDETRAIETALAATRAQLEAEIGLTARQTIEVPVLFRDGLAALPNAVNSLIVGRTVFVPDPGIAAFADDLRTRLTALGLTVHVLDSVEPYHVRGGELHCGTNTVRRPRRRRRH
jgi:protein-arginine deiminase